MGDFIYNGEHAIEISGKNTWDTWHIAPSSRPFVAAPTVKTSYIDVPGADGQLDYTEVLTGSPKYGMRTGSWQFLIDNDYWDFFKLESELLKYIHGKRHRIVLVDEPEYYYTGRLTMSVSSNKDYSSITINYTLDPYKYPTGSTKDVDWMWNELFENTIMYGKFSVKKSKYRNIINDETTSKKISITVSSDMKATINGTDIYLTAGNNVDCMTINPGDNEVIFTGNGIVTVDYTSGGIL